MSSHGPERCSEAVRSAILATAWLLVRSVVVAKLRNAAKAWWALLRQLIGSEWRQSSAGVCVVDCAVRTSILTAAELIEDTGDEFCRRILWDKNHILHALLPGRRPELGYQLTLRIIQS